MKIIQSDVIISQIQYDLLQDGEINTTVSETSIPSEISYDIALESLKKKAEGPKELCSHPETGDPVPGLLPPGPAAPAPPPVRGRMERRDRTRGFRARARRLRTAPRPGPLVRNPAQHPWRPESPGCRSVDLDRGNRSSLGTGDFAHLLRLHMCHSWPTCW